MTKAVFYQNHGLITRFDVSGHTADCDSEDARLVCAAVSSAVYMAANTVTDVIGAKADIVEKDGHLSLSLKSKIPACSDVLNGLLIHLKQLSQQYTNFIHITTEVQHDA